MKLLEGISIAVTGPGKGIGRGIATRLAAYGADLVLIGRTREDLVSTAEIVSRQDSKVEIVVGDVRGPALGDEVIRAAVDAFGAVHGLVNNAGVTRFAPIWEQSDEAYEEVVETNLTGPFLLSQSFIRYWLESGIQGRIVNIGSVESETPFPHQAPYAATKGGLLQLTKAMALELAPHGIRINQVDPGAIDTPMTGPYREKTVKKIPMGRLGQPDEIGECVTFLLSDMSGYVTGTKLVADGGYIIQ